MKTLKIDEELFRAILQHTSFVGETETQILRRLVGLSSESTSPDTESLKHSKMINHLSSSEFLFSKGAVGKFLSILAKIHELRPHDFHQVLSIKGRGRLYFSLDPESLEAAGKSVNPKQIPNTAYWVITNTSTATKRDMLREVMRVFGYSTREIAEATDAISQEA